MCHTAPYYFFGKDPTFALFCAFRSASTARQQNAWFYDGGGQEMMNEFARSTNLYASRRQYRRPDGRLVPQGDQDRRRISRASRFRIGGWAGKTLPSSASCRSRSLAATSIRRWRRAPSTPPNGSVPMTMRSSASTRSPSTTIIRAGGRAARRCILLQSRQMGCAAESLQGAAARRCGYAKSTCRRDTMPQPQALQAPGGRPGRSCARSARPSWKPV